MNKTDSPLCLMCKVGNEDTEHFILNCKKLEHIRGRYQNKLCNLLEDNKEVPFLEALLDSRSIQIAHPKTKFRIDELEEISRNYIFALHMERAEKMSKEAVTLNFR